MPNTSTNQDVFAGQWKQMRGELKSWWGKLADDDFDKIGGQKDKLIGVVQEKYGYAREKAQQEVERRLKEYGDNMSGSIATAVAAVTGGVESAQSALATGWESAQGAAATAATAVAGGVESANSYLQEKKFEEMATDLTALIREYPVQSLLVGMGLGYLLARLTAR
jgi:uncharacterized protein YjbJ (UPF0337 family)